MTAFAPPWPAANDLMSEVRPPEELAGAVINLVPHSVMTANGMVANDGLGILLSFSLPDEHFRARMQLGPYDDSEEISATGRRGPDEEEEGWG